MNSKINILIFILVTSCVSNEKEKLAANGLNKTDDSIINNIHESEENKNIILSNTDTEKYSNEKFTVLEDIPDILREIGYVQIPISDGKLKRQLNKEEQSLLKQIELKVKVKEFESIQKIESFKFKNEQPIKANGENYYPIIELQFWYFNDTIEANKCFKELLFFKNKPMFEKPPQDFILKDKNIIYLRTEAEIYRSKLNKIVELIKEL